MKTLKQYLLLFAVATLLLSACKKETDFIYEVDPVEVNQNNSDKEAIKTANEFIAIAYSDIYGQSITYSDLEVLQAFIVAFGDRTIIEDLIVLNFLNSPDAEVPTDAEMRADVPAFIADAYQRFFNREADEYELWYLEDYIANNTDLSPEVVYYSMLTSDEYRYY